MNVLDVIGSNTTISELTDKNRYQNALSKAVNDTQTETTEDTLAINASGQTDLARVQELQTVYQKNEISLNGLLEMQQRIAAFNSTQATDSNWSALSSELSAISRSTTFEGESVISYLSTAVDNEKSLYTFKTNMESEIENYTQKLNSERKEIAVYLVKQENQNIASAFSPDEAMSDVLTQLNAENAELIHGAINNANTLI